MTEHTITLEADGLTFAEGPRWHDGALWFSDFYSQQVLRMVPGEVPERIVDVLGQPSGLGWLPDGRLLVASQKDRLVVRLEPSGELVVHADLSSHIPAGPINDMVVSSNGRAYVGAFGFDMMGGAPFAKAPLICVDVDGSARVVSEPLFFPNGMAITPDGSTLIVSESMGNRLSAFDVAPDGGLGPRQDWAALGEAPSDSATDLEAILGAATFAPDGMCLDAEGAVWAADAVGARAVRVGRGGVVLDSVDIGEGCFACVLGGDDGRTLFLCVAPDFLEHNRAIATEAKILSTRVDVPAC